MHVQSNFDKSLFETIYVINLIAGFYSSSFTKMIEIKANTFSSLFFLKAC